MLASGHPVSPLLLDTIYHFPGVPLPEGLVCWQHSSRTSVQLAGLPKVLREEPKGIPDPRERKLEC